MLVKRTGFPIVPSLFDDLFRDWPTTSFSRDNATLPAVNIKEDENSFIVEVAVPGMNKEDFKIDLDNNMLTISSEKSEEKDDKKDNYTRKEYNYQSFKRSFTIPENVVDNEKISASYVNGELVITIPKLEEVKPVSRLIEIK